jgi:hypothetical protein
MMGIARLVAEKISISRPLTMGILQKDEIK